MPRGQKKKSPEQLRLEHAAEILTEKLNGEIRARGIEHSQIMWTQTMFLAPRPTVMVKTLMELQLKIIDYDRKCRSMCKFLSTEEPDDDYDGD